MFLLGDPTKFKRFETPVEYREHLAKCVGKIDKYTPFFGDVEVRKELAKKLSTQKWQLTEDEVILTSGGSGALYQCIQALASKGDKIMMPKPTFPLMQAFADFLEVKVVNYHLSYGDWQPDPAEVDRLLSENPDVKYLFL